MRVFLRLALAGLLTACSHSENSLLVEATPQMEASTLEVWVLDPKKARIVDNSGPQPVGPAQSHDGTLRVAVEFPSPRDVMLHLKAGTESGATLVATRCYSVHGIVRDHVALLQLDTNEDADGDGFSPDPAVACTDVVDGTDVPCRHGCTAQVAGDCDDHDSATYPGAPDRVCGDGIDRNCDGFDGCGDEDLDGWQSCSATDRVGTCDCDDADPAVHPGASEMCGNGADENCDGRDALCDNDGDGFPADRPVNGKPDCDDTDPTINPDAMERCTAPDKPPQDENCNGLIDELDACTPDDLDRDGSPDCSVARPGAPCDCNDCDPAIHPNATVICGNRVDEDCDGGVDEACRFSDEDSDGFPSTAVGGTDCNDTDPTIFPGAPEFCARVNGPLDDDCDGRSDEGCSEDTDHDGYVEPPACEGNPQVHPGKDETCNGVDDDCDGVPDEVLLPPMYSSSGIFLRQGDHGCIVGTPSTPGCTDKSCTVIFLENRAHCGACRANCNRAGAQVADRCVNAVCDCSSEPGMMACPGGTTCCPMSGCRDLRSDVNNCRACGFECDESSDRCVNGSCRCGSGGSCVAPLICCGERCIDPTADRGNCGFCGRQCGQDSQCQGAQCVCSGAFLDCDGRGGCEVDSLTDPQNCGRCGNKCSAQFATPICSGGSCSFSMCNAGFGDCDSSSENGCETPLNTTDNCGRCGEPCSRPHVVADCSSRFCRFVSCETGWGNCDFMDANGCEAPLNTSNNCGSCGEPCSRQHATGDCSTGTCRIGTCNSGWDNCDGSDGNGCETRLGTSSDCSACRDPCFGGPCCNGQCCQLGQTCTGGACVGGTPDAGP